jgi:hypothetical protein
MYGVLANIIGSESLPEGELRDTLEALYVMAPAPISTAAVEVNIIFNEGETK